jgi:hypothetical protein
VELGLAVQSAMRKYFQINGEFAGYLRYDKDLWQQFGQDQATVRSATPFALRYAMEGVLGGILDHQPGRQGGAHG